MFWNRRYLAFFIATGLLLLLIVAACGGGVTSSPLPTPTSKAVPTPTATPISVTTVTPKIDVTAELTPPSGTDVLIAKGEDVYQRTAGGVGCQACHGRDAKGLVGPNIRGATVTRVSLAFIRLSPEEVQAVAAYLQFLATQP